VSLEVGLSNTHQWLDQRIGLIDQYLWYLGYSFPRGFT
jgi:hypothetical protein